MDEVIYRGPYGCFPRMASLRVRAENIPQWEGTWMRGRDQARFRVLSRKRAGNTTNSPLAM